MISSSILYNKYAPLDISDIILPDRIMSHFSDGIIKQNFLFYGKQGSGKTSLAKVLSKKYDTKYINASLKTSIDVLRNEIYNFCVTSSFDALNTDKLVILDEIDGISSQFEEALRGYINDFPNVKFIATTNYISKLTEPIKSRFMCLNFDTTGDEEKKQKQRIAAQMKKVINNENIIIENNNVIVKLVNSNFPDIRKMYGKIQELRDSINRTITVDDVDEFSNFDNDFYDFILNVDISDVETLQHIIKYYGSKSKTELLKLNSDFLNYFIEKNPTKLNVIGKLLSIIVDGLYKVNSDVNPELTLASTICQIKNTIK